MNKIEINKSIWVYKNTIPTQLCNKCGYETKTLIDIYPLLKEYTIFNIYTQDDKIHLFATQITLDAIIALKIIFDAKEVIISNFTSIDGDGPRECIKITLS